MEVTRLFDLLPHYAKYFPKEDAVCGKENGVWVRYSTKDYIEKVNYISYGLMQLGIKKGDRIASISNNRPEWNFLDMPSSSWVPSMYRYTPPSAKVNTNTFCIMRMLKWSLSPDENYCEK